MILPIHHLINISPKSPCLTEIKISHYLFILIGQEHKPRWLTPFIPPVNCSYFHTTRAYMICLDIVDYFVPHKLTSFQIPGYIEIFSITEMRNAAISSLILDLLMLFAATVTAVVGLVTNQVICLMVTGVMFVLTG